MLQNNLLALYPDPANSNDYDVVPIWGSTTFIISGGTSTYFHIGVFREDM